MECSQHLDKFLQVNLFFQCIQYLNLVAQLLLQQHSLDFIIKVPPGPPPITARSNALVEKLKIGFREVKILNILINIKNEYF